MATGLNPNDPLVSYTPIPPPTPPLKGGENVAAPTLHPPLQGEGWGGDGLNNLLRRTWQAIRQLSGDDAYERYLAHHTACHADTAPLSRKEFFQHEQQQKWSDIKRCC